MADATLTRLKVMNMALGLLGDHQIEQADIADPSTERARKIVEQYASVVAAVLAEHPWNFALTRTTLYAYTEPATTLTPGATTGDGVTFTAGTTGIFGLDAVGKELRAQETDGEAEIAGLVTSTPAATLTPAAGALVPGTAGVVLTASASVFASGDVGKIVQHLAGEGYGTITAQGGTTITVTITEAFESTDAIASGSWRLVSTSEVTADISEDFPSTDAIDSGDWRLYNATPDHDYTYALGYPTDAVRIWRTKDSRDYQVEGDEILADDESLALRYVRLETNPQRWSPLFTRAVVYHLAAVLAEPITGQAAKYDRFWTLYERMLRRAKTKDGQEGNPEQLQSDDLVRVRLGGD